MLIHEGVTRTPEADRMLGLSLAAVAGALNTAGFYAVGLYASNMTGNVSAISDVLGSTSSTLLIRYRRRRSVRGSHAYSVCAEALLLVVLGLVALSLDEAARGHALVLGLSFTMGLQNAAVTKISDARVRTTHVTGTITDIGIELARWLDRGAPDRVPLKRHDPVRLQLHLLTVGAFLVGGLVGVVAYRAIGIALLFVAAAILAALALPALRR